MSRSDGPLPDHLRGELARSADATLDEARMLPLEVYRSDQVLQAEHATILDRGWHCVGRTAELARVGDHLVGHIPYRHADGSPGTRAVLVAHGDDGVLRAFDDVCVHRGAQLVTGPGNEPRFTCPYHAWVYRLDGQLVGAPHMTATAGFDPGAHRLGCLALEVWEGFVFVCGDPDPAPLAPRLTGLTVCAHLVRWGERVTPLTESDAALPPVKKSALEMIQGIRSGKTNVKERSGEGLRGLRFIEQIYAD